MITIDGITYNVGVIAIRRKGEFLDKYARRTQDGKLHRELIGVYFNYELQFGHSNDIPEYAALWDKLTEPVEFHEVTVPDGPVGTVTFSAYFAGVADELLRANEDENFWKSLVVNFISEVPARTPS